jgi:ParB family chromosome partitioning protein
MTELTAHRTLALREAVANDPDTAFIAMLHALCLKLFYRFGLDGCLEVEAKSVLFGTQRSRGSATCLTPRRSTCGTAPGRLSC